MTDFDKNHDDEEEVIISKTQIKREMQELQAIGERLLKVKKANLKNFPLNDELLAAVEESSRIKSHEGMRRHLQYIGKQMRHADVEGIVKELDKLDPASELYLRIQNQAEAWRLKLIKTDNTEGEWFERFPETDRQQFRSIVRAAKKEQPVEADAPFVNGKNGKKLFQWIRLQLLE